MTTQLPALGRASFFFFLLGLNSATAALYSGNGGGSPVGNGTLSVSDNGKTVYWNLTSVGSWSANNMVVVFIDSVPGGWTSTSGCFNSGNSPDQAVSGFDGSRRATARFADGFGADYALVIAPKDEYYNAFYHLAADGTLEYMTGHVGYTPSGSGCTDQFDWSQVGLPNGNGNSIKFETTYINGNAVRSLQSFESFTADSQAGLPGTVTFRNYDSYPIAPVPEPTDKALAAFGGMAAIAGLWSWVGRRWRARESGRVRNTAIGQAGSSRSTPQPLLSRSLP